MKRCIAFCLALGAALSLTACGGGDTEGGLLCEASGIRPDTVLLSVDGRDVSAQRYLYWLAYACDYIADYYDSGEGIQWGDTVSGQSLEDYAKDQALQNAALYATVETWAEDYGCTLTDEDRTAMDREWAARAAQYGGEEAYLAVLARMGLDVSEEHFYTSALATAAFLKEQAPGCSAFVIGEAGLLNALYDAGITMNDVNPDYVVVGEGRSYSLDTLTKATNLVMQGAKLIGANSDVSGPIENGIAPACRALIAPIEMATGKQAYFCGKPNPLMMRTGLKKLNCHSGEAVMVGDRMDTDVISGMESGMSTVLVLSGVSTRETLKTYAYRPSIVLDGVGDIAAMARREKA